VLEITGEVVPECRDRAIALLWIFLERFGYDRVEVSEKRTAKRRKADAPEFAK